MAFTVRFLQMFDGGVRMCPEINKKETGIYMRKLMDRRGITVRDIQEYLGLASVQSIYHWLNGVSMPTVDNLYALSELFRMPMDDMLRGNRRRIVARMENAYIENTQGYTSHYTRLEAYYKRLADRSAA